MKIFSFFKTKNNFSLIIILDSNYNEICIDFILMLFFSANTYYFQTRIAVMLSKSASNSVNFSHITEVDKSQYTEKNWNCFQKVLNELQNFK